MKAEILTSRSLKCVGIGIQAESPNEARVLEALDGMTAQRPCMFPGPTLSILIPAPLKEDIDAWEKDPALGSVNDEQLDNCRLWASREGHINIRDLLNELKIRRRIAKGAHQPGEKVEQ